MPTLNLNASPTLRIGSTVTPRVVFVFAGQSNMSGYSPMIALGPTASVPAYAQTAGNEWTGASPASIDTGATYDFPTAPCLYNQNTNGVIGDVYDGWGAVLKQYPGPTGSIVNASRGVSGQYGLELSFLLSHVAAYPSVPIAAIKCSLGGTSLAADWLPASTGSNGTGSDRGQFAILKLMIQQAAARLDAAGSAWRWGGFVWMQGESGAHTHQADPSGASDAVYLADARLFFAAVRGLTRADLPVVVGRIGDNWIDTNPYLVAAGNGCTAIDYSIASAGATVDSTTRARALAGANRRRATQQTLGGDADCAWWSNDGYPTRPPYALTDATTDLTGYHWGGPGNLTAGERAFAAYQAARN